MKRSLFFMLILWGSLLFLNGCGREVSKEKIQITYSTYAPVEWDAIRLFNANNDTYEVVCVPYLEKIDNYERYEDYLKQLNLQIMAGTAPDMFTAVPDFYFTYDDRDFVSYVEKGVLEDLRPYMERDFEEGEYLQSVVYSFEKDGGVYALPYQFRLGFQIANGSGLENVEGWTFQEMKAYMDKHSEIMIYDIDKEWNELLRDFILYGGIPLNDYDTIRECILFAEKYDKNKLSKEEREIATKKALVTEFGISGPREWFSILSTWGETPDFVGLPRENRTGTLQYSSTISMNAASENKEGVWEFFAFLMSEEYQSTLQYFPVRREQYDAYWEYYLTPQLRKLPNEVDGGYIEQYELNYFRNGEEIHCMSKDDKARMEELIESSTTFVWDMDIPGFHIIMEEADSYYVGGKSIDEVMELIENRIELYLEEKK